MQIELDTTKLPEGMTEEQVIDAIESSLMVYIGDFGGAPGHEERVKTCAHVWLALMGEGPCPPTEADKARDEAREALMEMNSKDLAYLRLVRGTHHGHNDYMPQWRENEAIRTKLKELELVTVESYPAAHMGDVATTVCEITAKGRNVLKRTA